MAGRCICLRLASRCVHLRAAGHFIHLSGAGRCICLHVVGHCFCLRAAGYSPCVCVWLIVALFAWCGRSLNLFACGLSLHLFACGLSLLLLCVSGCCSLDSQLLNKIERLFGELCLTAPEAFDHLRRVTEQVNAVIASFQNEETMKILEQGGNVDYDQNSGYFSPEKGNVIFGSAYDR